MKFIFEPNLDYAKLPGWFRVPTPLLYNPSRYKVATKLEGLFEVNNWGLWPL